MRTSLDHLPAMRRAQLLDITKVIARGLRPEKIILFGIFAAEGGGTGDPVHSGFRFLPGGYELLVVTRKGDRRYDYEIQDMIENRCRVHAPVTVLVHDIVYVNDQLSAGHYFFSMLEREAIMLHDAGDTPLSAGSAPDLATIRAVAEKDFERWWRRASAFFKKRSVQQAGKKSGKIAAFLLHQSAESAYQAILSSFTGYKPCTHNLDKLRRYTNRFSIELATLFSRNEPEEERLFKLLSQGYVDARYKEEYTITEEELGLLTERIDRLLSIAVRICRNRFTSLERDAGCELRT